MTLLNRPILVWVVVLLFGLPAVFYIVAHALVLTGAVAPPANMASHFQRLDTMTLLINGAEAAFLIVAMASLIAMRRIALPLCVVYFSADLMHEVSGRYLDEPNTVAGILVTGLIGAAVIAYVWFLKRRGLLR